MNILVIGGGGREHAVVMKLAESKKVEKIYCTPGNGGIAEYAECFDVKATDFNGVLALAQKLNPDYIFIAPDDPLVMGMTDFLEENGFKTFGPRKNAAILEGSKSFSKSLMERYDIPTAAYREFDDAKKAIEYIKNGKYPVVIKADGLALGKGVIIAENEKTALKAIKNIMVDKKFGDSGNKIVIEEFLIGPEVSLLCFTDGKSVKPMLTSMDHKRVWDGDRGLNTGGMGAIAPNPYYTPVIADETLRKIVLPTINAMANEGTPFKGCLYFGLMLTPDGVKVIEYNCRFGDPETQAVLPMLKTDLADIIEAVYNETLAELDIEWEDGACCCVVMASGGYPEKYVTGVEITGLDEKGQLENAFIYHAGTKFTDKFCTSGGRVLGVTAKSDNLAHAIRNAYASVVKIDFKNKYYRTDIGQKALIAQSS
ncbi:MAG: phosphoribosylamine--glycine ligase [Oscillospiraceae bacterium]|jgi:phosphoribosylamine--glycine ligase|nr:phosphoribosylamine--glycine ligase [Oscillospiraceae bacterium]